MFSNRRIDCTFTDGSFVGKIVFFVVTSSSSSTCHPLTMRLLKMILKISAPSTEMFVSYRIPFAWTHIYDQIGKGSDMARGDDTGSLKTAVVEWVNGVFGASDPPLRPKYKEGRGLDNDYCGQLLCPSEFDWSDAR
jgi:hypothetical protein